MLPASRIIGDPSMSPHLAERYLYFPSVGLAIALAFGFRSLARRTDILMVASVIVLTIIVLTPITWARNAVWASEIQLYESEYHIGNNTPLVLVWLTAAYMKKSEFQRVGEICDRQIEAQKQSGKLSTHCATAYSRLGRLDEAERAYLSGTNDKKVRAIAHANLGRFYLRQDRWSDAKIHFEKAIKAETLPASRAYREGHMLVRLYPSDRQKLLEAKAHFEQALQLQPDFLPARRWLTRVDRALELQ
jgi:tetratricopeptide (TPR) repeat protein